MSFSLRTSLCDQPAQTVKTLVLKWSEAVLAQSLGWALSAVEIP